MKYENVKLGDYERVTETHVYFWEEFFHNGLPQNSRIQNLRKHFAAQNNG